MPYIDFESEDDFASLWYITNAPHGNVGGFNPELPTVLLMHGTYLDSSWFGDQFGDPRLTDGYNMVAFDMRVCGKSTCRSSGRHDSFVEAADIAKAHMMLHLPPCHVLAYDTLGCCCALRFASLFPELCLSLILCSPGPPQELQRTLAAYDEVLQQWSYAEDMDSFERFGMEATTVMLGADLNPDLQEELVTYWEMNLPPIARKRILEQVNVIVNRSPFPSTLYAGIRQPVLIVHGERDQLNPLKYSEMMVQDLVNVAGGARLYVVKGAAGGLAIVPTNSSITNQVIAKFLRSLPHARSDILPPHLSIPDQMQLALKRLADAMGDASIARREPLNSLSFSCLTPEVVKSQSDALVFYRRGFLKAFNPLGPHGRPIRKLSDRMESHWFHGGADGLSYAGTTFSRKQQHQESGGGRSNKQPLPPLPSSEPISLQVIADGQMKRTTAFNQNSVDRQVIRGSMAKIVANSPASNTIQRFF